MKRYVMMRIPGTHAPTKHRRSPGVHCTSLGRLGGDEPARLTDAKPGTKDRQGLKRRVWRLPTVTAFPLKVRWQGAGWNRRAPRAGHWCVGSSESVDGPCGHSLAGAWQ